MIDTIRILGDPVLRQRAAPFAGDPVSLLARLEVTMRAAKGIGLAAPQIGESVRMAVVLLESGTMLRLVNPRILRTSKEQEIAREGCLSIPSYEVPVRRPVAVTIVDMAGIAVELSGMDARAAQHELDHLDGILILDRWLEQQQKVW